MIGTKLKRTLRFYINLRSDLRNMENLFAVKEIEKKDIQHIVKYWSTISTSHLESMGIKREELYIYANLGEYIEKQISLPYEQKSALFMIGLIDGEPYGHCYVNSIKFREEAHMHLHIWNSDRRQKGLGSQMVKRSIPYFFKNLEIKNLISEPYYLNSAPNKTLVKLGFQFEKCYVSKPSGWNFELKVHRWKLTKPVFKEKFM